MQKIICFLSLFCFLTIAMAPAADFNPTVMELNVPDVIQYDFDGSGIDIGFNISGVGGAFYLVINTVGQAENVGWVQNGFLGWHTVNNIDTTVYISNAYERSEGDAVITWDGNDQDGNQVEPGTYQYAIWGYDNWNSRIPACMYMTAGSSWRSRNHYMWTHDDNGMPMDQPMMTSGVRLPGSAAEGAQMHGMQQKWVVGGDPNDANNLQTTFCPNMYPDWAYAREHTEDLVGVKTYTNPIFVPGTDFGQFVQVCMDFENKRSTVFKWAWVNGGNAVLDESWGGWDNITWDEQVPLHRSSVPPGAYTDPDREYIWIQSADQTGLGKGDWIYLRCVDWEGEQVFDKQMLEFYMPEDVNANDSENCALLDIAFGIHDGDMLLGTMGCCYHEFINGNVILDDDGADLEEYLKWGNGNGDFFLDVYYQADAAYPWACLDNTGKTFGIHRVDDVYVDAEGFSIQYITYIGAYSFGVQTQDGSAINYMQLADDSVPDAQQRGGGKIADYGSNYDGLYIAPAVTEEGGAAFGTETDFIAFDSVSGIISSEVAVDEDAAAAFAVSQNSPNPFNPTTTINFTLPANGNVSVEVFNIAGQKVDTLVDDYMNAGQHNVVWDASGYSNGVYFYTVESGNYSSTMKMTLLK